MDDRHDCACVSVMTCKQLSEHHMWRGDYIEHLFCVHGSLSLLPQLYKTVKETQKSRQLPQVHTMWPKSRWFEPDAPHARRGLSDRVTRDLLAFLPVGIMLKINGAPNSQA